MHTAVVNYTVNDSYKYSYKYSYKQITDNLNSRYLTDNLSYQEFTDLANVYGKITILIYKGESVATSCTFNESLKSCPEWGETTSNQGHDSCRSMKLYIYFYMYRLSTSFTDSASEEVS